MKIINFSSLLALILACTSISAVEPMEASALVESCELELSGNDLATEPCSAYIKGYLAGSTEIIIGARQETASDLMQRALQTRAGGRALDSEEPLFCIPDSAGSAQIAQQIVQLGATFEQQLPAEHLMLSVLQQYYRCEPA